jgi:hypothetical protein
MKLGDKVKDIVTGFQGMATVYAQYLTGSDRVCVTPEVDKDGNTRADQWFDVDRIEVIEKSRYGRWGIHPIERIAMKEGT